MLGWVFIYLPFCMLYDYQKYKKIAVSTNYDKIRTRRWVGRIEDSLSKAR